MTNKQTVFHLLPKEHYQLTELEQLIAKYFLEQEWTSRDFSALHVAQELHVSKAALTRFAQKCGFAGYREFVFQYQLNLTPEQANPSPEEKKSHYTLSAYHELIDRIGRLLATPQVDNLVSAIRQADKVYFLGMQQLIPVAQQYKQAFLSLGKDCDALRDQQETDLASAFFHKKTLLIGLANSEQVEKVGLALQSANQKGADCFLLAPYSNKHSNQLPFQVIPCYPNHLAQGISPQIPFLLLLDFLRNRIVKA